MPSGARESAADHQRKETTMSERKIVGDMEEAGLPVSENSYSRKLGARLRAYRPASRRQCHTMIPALSRRRRRSGSSIGIRSRISRSSRRLARLS